MKILESLPSQAELSEFESTVSALDDLPTMPAVVQRLLAITASDDCSLDDVEQLVTADQALSVKLMRLASSAAMSPRPVTSLRAALIRLGLRNLRKLIIAALLINAPAPGRLHKLVWKYSLTVAAVAEALVPHISVTVEDPFLCGLLHDFGIVALERVLGNTYGGAFGEPGTRHHLTLERESFAFDHCDMGAILAREWNLFPALVSVMQLHHSPMAAREVTDDEAFASVCVVALARDVVFEDVDETTALVADAIGLKPADLGTASATGLATFERVYAGLLS